MSITREIPEKVNVLFVDDEEEILKALKRQISMIDDIEGFYETNPLNVKNILDEENINIIVADIVMPEKDGITLLKEIKKDYPNIVRILLTAHGDFETSLRAINEADVFGFITKPWEKNYLFGHIEMAKNVVTSRINEDIKHHTPFLTVALWDDDEVLKYFLHTSDDEEIAKYITKRMFMTSAGLFGYKYRFSDNKFTLPLNDLDLVLRCYLTTIDSNQFSGNIGFFAFMNEISEDRKEELDKAFDKVYHHMKNGNFEESQLGEIL